MMAPVFDLQTTPFSCYGSYIAISRLAGDGEMPAGVYLRSLRGPLVGASPWQPIFRLELLAGGAAVEAEVTATPTLLRLAHGESRVELCFETADRVRVQGSNAGLRLAMQPSGYDFALPGASGRWQVVVCSSVETKFMLGSLQGTVHADVAWTGLRATSMGFDLLPASDGSGEWHIDEFTSSWPQGELAPDFSSALQAVTGEYERWEAGCLGTAPRYPDAVRSAAYVTWSCVVAPAGHLRRPAMYMSKNAMASIWSWDNCFNALALAPWNPQLAWEQLMVMVDLQDADGVLPDLANDRFVSWSFCKPPVYGWTLLRMAQVPGMLTAERLAEIHTPLCRMTEWWLRRRDENGDGIPQYNHGNESGWDNSTIFGDLPPVDSPDLSTYLVLQMEFLAWSALQLGDREQSSEWQSRSEQLLQRMITCFWRGDRFVARHSRSGAEIDCDSLLLLIPLLLGKRLPPDITSALVRRLQRPGCFLTAFGLASESTSSEQYRPDGYWRGPIWGAPVVMLVDGLAAAGETALAGDIRRRFCDLVATRGLAENYNALSGEPLRDRAFTWTASAFLLLAAQTEPASL